MILASGMLMSCFRATPLLETLPIDDPLVGWFKLSGLDTSGRFTDPRGPLVPVFYVDGAYYSVCRGMEIPFKKVAGGIVWALAPSSMVGTQVLYDASASTFSITICRDAAEAMAHGLPQSRTHPLTRVDPLMDLMDSTAKAPRSNDDFVGFYVPLWFPAFYWDVKKQKEGFVVAGHTLPDPSQPDANPRPDEGLTGPARPLPDRLGFKLKDLNETANDSEELVYNEPRERFELRFSSAQTSATLAMPLARVARPPSNDALVKWLQNPIGIPPAWH
jgi:hypothetical protein